MRRDSYQEESFGREPLGTLVGGSLLEGLDVRLGPQADVERLAVGTYVTIEGRDPGQPFFGMITDVALASTLPGFAATPPEVFDDFAREVLAGTALFAVAKVRPMLRYDPAAQDTRERLKPVKTIPNHFARVLKSSQQDITLIFGDDDSRHFIIGSPLDMDVKVCLDYERFIERSNGVFGKSGTGKTFLTRLILASLIQKSNAQRNEQKKCVNLVFDMHNEYGWKGSREGGSGEVKGLKQLFRSSVCVYTLDEDSALRRGINVDGVVRIGLEEIEAGDIAILRETLNLTERAVDAAFLLEDRLGKHWLRRTLTDDEAVADLVRDGRIHEQSLHNLKRGLDRIRRLDFMSERSEANVVQTIVGYLQGGRSVVLEFGSYGDNLAAYILVANILTRRIHDAYRLAVERAMGDPAKMPNHLVITVEEAHKFLDPEVGAQTIFGQIAREMRKYNVTLLIVDQRPSGIDAEVLSQIATKFCCLLDNEHDVDAVLGGVSGGRELRGVLARLESKQQALIFGHAVPMPIVVRVEDYGSEESYRRLSGSRDGLSLGSRLDLYGRD